MAQDDPDVERLRRDRERQDIPGRKRSTGAYYSYVATAQTGAAEGHYFTALPYDLFGAEAEGKPGAFASIGTPVLVVQHRGRRNGGDLVMIHHEPYRWFTSDPGTYPVTYYQGLILGVHGCGAVLRQAVAVIADSGGHVVLTLNPVGTPSTVSLAPGVYRITVSHPGYLTVTIAVTITSANFLDLSQFGLQPDNTGYWYKLCACGVDATRDNAPNPPIPQVQTLTFGRVSVTMTGMVNANGGYLGHFGSATVALDPAWRLYDGTNAVPKCQPFPLPAGRSGSIPMTFECDCDSILTITWPARVSSGVVNGSGPGCVGCEIWDPNGYPANCPVSINSGSVASTVLSTNPWHAQFDPAAFSGCATCAGPGGTVITTDRAYLRAVLADIFASTWNLS